MKKKFVLFLILFLLTLIVFSQFLLGHYATDTYNIAKVGYEKYATNWSLKDGRVVMYMITMVANILKINIKVFVILTLLLSIIISNISVIKLNGIITKYKEPQTTFKKVLIIAISYIIVFNFMYLENLYFVESLVMSSSILFLIISADKIVENNEKSNIIKSLLYVLISVFCYQGTIGFLLALVATLTIIKNKNDIKRILIDLAKCLVTIGLAISANIIFVKLIVQITGMQQTRAGSISLIFSNIIYICSNLTKILIESIGLFPPYLQSIFTILILGIFMIYILKNKNEDKFSILRLIILMLIIFASGFFTYLLSLTSFFTGRLRFSIGAMIGLMFMYIYLSTNILDDKIFKYIIISILYTYILITITQYIVIMYDSKKVNLQEKQDVTEMLNCIKKYEEETFIKIEKIAVGIEKNHPEKTYYKNIKSRNVLTYNAIKCDWSVDGVIYYYTGINLDKYYISNIDKLLEDTEEYKCIGNTLYIKAYNY